MKLGRLEKLDLRTYWKNEPSDFTPWLAQEENIQLLSEEIGIELEVQSQEESVGPFSADILCKDTINDHYVLIENQLEITNHKHLGQLMTYAAGLDAKTIIWIAQKFTDEHRAALDWLNRITDDTFNFFGIEIELYKIEDSKPAPKFNIVSKPNDWAKQVKKSTSSQSATELNLLQQEYWQGLKEFMEGKKSFVKIKNPPLKQWMNIAIGKANFNLNVSVNSRDKSLNIGLNIKDDKTKKNYDKLYEISYKNSLTEISPDLVWDKMEGNKMSSVILKTSADFSKKDDWNRQFEWIKEYLEKYTEYFKEKVKKI